MKCESKLVRRTGEWTMKLFRGLAHCCLASQPGVGDVGGAEEIENGLTRWGAEIVRPKGCLGDRRYLFAFRGCRRMQSRVAWKEQAPQMCGSADRSLISIGASEATGVFLLGA